MNSRGFQATPGKFDHEGGQVTSTAPPHFTMFKVPPNKMPRNRLYTYQFPTIRGAAKQVEIGLLI